MHKFVHVLAWSLKFVTPPPEPEFFSNEYETLKILTISILAHVHWVPSYNWSPLHSPCFLPPFVTSYDSLPRTHSLPYLWRTLMKFRDTLNFSTMMVFVIMSAEFFFVLIFTKSIILSSTTHWYILRYITSMYFVRLWCLRFLVRWITFWLSQWTRTEFYIISKVSTNFLNHKAFFDASTTTVTPGLANSGLIIFIVNSYDF